MFRERLAAERCARVERVDDADGEHRRLRAFRGDECTGFERTHNVVFEGRAFGEDADRVVHAKAIDHRADGLCAALLARAIDEDRAGGFCGASDDGPPLEVAATQDRAAEVREHHGDVDDRSMVRDDDASLSATHARRACVAVDGERDAEEPHERARPRAAPSVACGGFIFFTLRERDAEEHAGAARERQRAESGGARGLSERGRSMHDLPVFPVQNDYARERGSVARRGIRRDAFLGNHAFRGRRAGRYPFVASQEAPTAAAGEQLPFEMSLHVPLPGQIVYFVGLSSESTPHELPVARTSLRHDPEFVLQPSAVREIAVFVVRAVVAQLSGAWRLGISIRRPDT